MRIGSINRSLGVELAFGLFLAVLAAQPEPAFAQAPAAAPVAGGATQAPVSPGVNAKPAPSTPAETGSKPPPGVPDDASAVTLELTSRPVAFTSASAEWANAIQVGDRRDSQSRCRGQKGRAHSGGTSFRFVSGNRRQKLSVRGDGPARRKTRGQGSLRWRENRRVPCRQGDQVPASRRLRRYRFRPTISSPLFSTKKVSNCKTASSRNILPIRRNQTTETSKPTSMFFSSSFPEFRSRLRKPASDTHRCDFCGEALGVDLDRDATEGCRPGCRFEPRCG